MKKEKEKKSPRKPTKAGYSGKCGDFSETASGQPGQAWAWDGYAVHI